MERDINSSDIKEKIGARVQMLRKNRGANETQLVLAKAIGASKETISQVEQGRSNLTVDNAIAIADRYEVSLDWLCGRTDNIDDTNKTLDCLCKYVKLSTDTSPFDETNENSFRSLYIDSNFANLLENLRIIPTVGELLNEEMKSNLIEIEKQKFSAAIVSGMPQNFLKFALLIPKLNPKGNEILADWLSDLLNQQIKVKFDSIEPTSHVPSV